MRRLKPKQIDIDLLISYASCAKAMKRYKRSHKPQMPVIMPCATLKESLKLSLAIERKRRVEQRGRKK